MPQLDAIRAIAISLVMLAHWLPESNPIQRIFPATIGVFLFFVLSGFLISMILIKNKQNVEENKSNTKRYFIRFYIRRTLRIFPIYYLTLVIIYLADVFPVRESWLWHTTYTSNWFLVFKGDWYGWTSHFWTLSVEEQFYLIWPFIILITPVKHFKKMLWGIMSFSILFKIVCYFMEVPLIDVLTPSCIDAFAMGTLLAYNKVTLSQDRWNQIYSFKNLLFISSIMGYLLLLLINFRSNKGWLGNENFFWVSFHSIVGSTIFVFIIAKASNGFKGLGKQIFENPALIYLGKISYASYIFHELIPQFSTWICKTVKIEEPQLLGVRFLVYFIITIVLASISWFFLEKPISRIKTKFSY